MTPPSAYLCSINSRTMAPSSIQGTGAQSFVTARRNGWAVVSGIELGPTSWRRVVACSLVKPCGFGGCRHG